MNTVKKYALAVASVAVTGAAYLIGVLPADGGFGDVTTVQWLGLIVFEGAAFGITQKAQNTPVGRHSADLDNLEE
ncbi:MAG: hypothetical protein H6515_14190 [Microthrixaceae bacterium]|nr:hypothetical protein [Microthrixaceae bacterium]